jgi:hypothetical protein
MKLKKVIPILASLIALVVISNKLQYNRAEASLDTFTKALRVWAHFGPYSSGTDSERILVKAIVLVTGDGKPLAPEGAHAKAFDADPKAWEETRIEGLRNYTPEIQGYVEKLQQLLAKDQKQVPRLVLESTLNCLTSRCRRTAYMRHGSCSELQHPRRTPAVAELWR